jgi:carbon starvation protein
VGRYLLHDVLGSVWRPLGQTKSLPANVATSTLMVGAWGYFLIQGVRDPLGGINSLWPLFGIANQLLASVALCLGTTILLKMHLAADPGSARNRPALALVMLIPLLWLLAVTMTAGAEKVFHSKPSIGFLSKAQALNRELPALEQSLSAARAGGDLPQVEKAEKAVHNNRTEHFNQVLDAIVALTFLVLVIVIVFLSVREWVLLLARRRLAVLQEAAPVWLPDYARVESRPAALFGLLALAFALIKELSGEAQMDRLKTMAVACACEEHSRPLLGAQTDAPRPAGSKALDKAAYAQMTEHRFTGVRRCC